MAEYPPSSIVAIGIILPLIALFAVILRFYLRLFIKPTYIGIDDWLILGAVILSMADGANLAVGMYSNSQMIEENKSLTCQRCHLGYSRQVLCTRPSTPAAISS